MKRYKNWSWPYSVFCQSINLLHMPTTAPSSIVHHVYGNVNCSQQVNNSVCEYGLPTWAWPMNILLWFRSTMMYAAMYVSDVSFYPFLQTNRNGIAFTVNLLDGTSAIVVRNTAMINLCILILLFNDHRTHYKFLWCWMTSTTTIHPGTTQ